MKTLTITIEVDGNEVSRSFAGVGTKAWNEIIESMLDTLAKSNDKEF